MDAYVLVILAAFVIAGLWWITGKSPLHPNGVKAVRIVLVLVFLWWFVSFIKAHS